MFQGAPEGHLGIISLEKKIIPTMSAGGCAVGKSSGKKIRIKELDEFYTPYTVKAALTKGDVFTYITMLIMGLGNIVRGQIVKGLLFLGIEVAYVWFMITKGIGFLQMLPSLGWLEQQKVWNEKKQVFVYEAGHNSVLILLYGVITIGITAFFIMTWCASVKSAYKAQCLKKAGVRLKSIKDDIKDLFDTNLHKLLLAVPLTGITAFTVLPLIFMISMAFTNYSKAWPGNGNQNKLILFDWVGLKNFGDVLDFNNTIGQEFWSVLGWTIIWAIFATFLNYLFGMILAIVINRQGTRFKAFWRFCFVISIAVPQFVSLLIMRTMLSQEGPVNNMLLELGWIEKALPFWTNATYARVSVIAINLWVGIPYTMLQVTGILQNIPAELYESAKVDGANAVVTFFKITLPYMLFVTTPYMITQFTGNINNFNVIFLLSGGNPTPVENTAGKTDLLVTWLYKLTIDKQYYNLGAVIGIMTFIVLAIVALATYQNTGSYKNEEEFS